MDLIKQNFVQPTMIKLQDVEQQLVVKRKIYKLRGIINFHGSERSGLRCASGHYTACSYRSNEKWELYDDTKTKIHNIHSKEELNIELIIFTL